METTDQTRSLFAAKKRLTFTLLCLATFMLLYVKIAFIEYETAAFEFLMDQPEGAVLHTISGLKFLSVPLVYLWKFTVLGFLIWVGCFMFGYRVTYSQCWSIMIVSEFTFLVAEVAKIFWFFFFDTDPTYEDIRGFYPFSLMNFFDYQVIDRRYAYPLRSLNLFEIAYWFVLVAGIHHFARKKKTIAWFIVLSSYVLIFFLWLWFYIIVYK